jgi:hypothetical protein
MSLSEQLLLLFVAEFEAVEFGLNCALFMSLSNGIDTYLVILCQVL